MGKPFNGDFYLEQEFLNLRNTFGITHVIETGTYHGHTTTWLAENFDHVTTIESNPAYIDIALSNWTKDHSISLIEGSSAELLGDILDAYENEKLLIFLDAHWYKNPVLDELTHIANSGHKPILVIHDFKVPDKPEFGYDEYPNEKIVYEWAWIEDKIHAIYGEDFDHYYNIEATGAMRGCVFVIPKEND